MTRILAISLLLAPAVAMAEAPTTIHHQGRIFDSTSGLPLDGSHTVDFRLYDDATSGTELWTENHTLTFDQGYFAVTLGETTAIDGTIANGQSLWLTIAVDSGAELPAVPLDSVPYAIHSSSADVAASVVVGGTTVVDSSGNIDWNRIVNAPSGSTDTLAGLSCGTDEVAVWDGSAWDCGSNLPTHAHEAVDITSGIMDISRLPVGTGADQVAGGNHTHTAADLGALPSAGGTLTGAISGTDASFANMNLTGTLTIGDLTIDPATGRISRACDDGDENAVWSAGNGHCYMNFTATKLSYGDAQIACEYLGGYLASISHKAENDFIVATFGASGTNTLNSSWIGLNDIRAEGQWEWTHGGWGVVADDTPFTDWNAGEPNDAGGIEDCGQFWSGDHWNDHQCQLTFNYLCERDN